MWNRGIQFLGESNTVATNYGIIIVDKNEAFSIEYSGLDSFESLDKKILVY